MSGNTDFIRAPLVVWLQSYLEAPITSNTQLSNGTAMAHVLKMIDPMAFSCLRVQHNLLGDITTRAQNLVEILHGIKRFYQEKLQQLIVMKMPDILTVAKEPETELARTEINTILLLILGCAVQCDRKQEFIEHIKELDVEVQRGLVASIQEVTENQENVIPYRISELAEMNPTDLMTLSESLYHQLLKVLEQTDEYVDTIIDLALLHDEEDTDDIVEESPRFRTRHPLSPRTSFRSTNILHANRQRMQSLQNDLDERNAYISDMKEELEQMKMQLDNVRMENKGLVNEAAWAKSYRDELDILKSEVERNNKIQAENSKLKEKARDLDFYKKRYEEMKEQSDLLYESKMVLEERVAGSSVKINNFSRLEEENNRLFSQVKVLTDEREEDRKRIHDLVNEVAKLTMEKQESISAYSMMNAELDGLRMQKDGDGLGIPLLMEYNQTTDAIRLEKENKHLLDLVEQMRNSTPDGRSRQLEEENRTLSDNIYEYKSMISKLTKSLLLEKDSNRQLTDVLGSQTDNIKNLQGSLTKRSSELEQATVELENLTKELAERGVLIDVNTLKQALEMGNSANGSIYGKRNTGSPTYQEDTIKSMSNLALEKQVKETNNENKQLKADLTQKVEDLQSMERRVKEVETYGKKVEEQLELREKDISNLERRMEQKVTENKSLQQNALIQSDKVSALEERVSHLLSSANEDTRKVNKSLEVKLQRISELEMKLLQFDELEKEKEKIEELLKMKEDKTSQLQEELKQNEEKHRELEVEFEKARNVCAKLEHTMRLKDEKIMSLESSVDELTTSANSKQAERIELLMKSLDNRGTDIIDLEKKIEELVDLNSKLKTANRAKSERIETLEESLSELEGQLEGKEQRAIDDRVHVLNKKLTEREGHVDELEVKLEEVSNQLNKSNRSILQRDEKISLLEQKLQDMDETAHQKERLTKLLDDRSKKILDLEMQLDNVQNEKIKLERTIAQKESEYEAATKSLGTLEASITDQSSLSKLIELKDTKIAGLQASIDDKDENIVQLENMLSESDGKLKKMKHTMKLKEEKIADLEQNVDKLDDLESKNHKLQSAIEYKDAKMCELEDRLDQMNELSRTNARLKENVESKEEKISSLEQRIDDLEDAVKMNERLNQQVKQKEERINSLQQRIQDLETRLHNSEQSRDQIKRNAEQEISKLSEQNQELSEVKVKRQMSIMRREKKIVNLESKLNEYATEKEEKESKIQNLQNKLEGTMSKYRKLDMSSEEKDQKMNELEARLDELKDTYTEHQRLLRDYKQQEVELTNLRQLVENRDVNNNKYTEQLLNKEQAVEELQENLGKTLALNNRLDEGIKKHQEKIRQLEKTLQETETNLEKSSSDVTSKERTIERNKVKLDELQEQLGDKERELIELDKRLVVLEGSEQEKERLLKIVKEKESFIAQLETQIKLLQNSDQDEVLKQKEEMMESMQKKINEAVSEKHKMKLNLQEQEGIVSDLERRIEELQLTASDSDKLSSIVKEKNSQIAILRKNLDEYQTNSTQLETKIEELMSEHARQLSSDKLKDERLQSLKGQLEEHRNKNHSLANELNMKEEKLKSLKKSLEEMAQRNKDLEDDINMLEKDLEELKTTGSLKNITNITNKIQLTKRARTELHIQRGPPKKSPQKGQQIEIKMSPGKEKEEEVVNTQSREEIERLQDENDCLEKQKEYLASQLDEINAENASLITQNETLQSDFQLLKVDYEGVQNEMNEAREHFQELDVSATKIAHRCEVLVQLNATLEEENKALMDQVNKLLSQNQDLLISTLQSREQYLDDERAFSDHIYGLEREKEKLSEKVMAAEKALQDSGQKKKGKIWKGLLKKAGIKKKKGYSPNSTPSPDEMVPDLSPQSTPVKASYVYTTDGSQTSHVGPIRGLLSRSRQDVSKLNESELVVRRGSGLEYSQSTASDGRWKNRPKSAFISFDMTDSPSQHRRTLHRPKSMEDISTGTFDEMDGGRDPDDECDIIPLSRGDSSRSNSRKMASSTPSSRITSPTSSTHGASTPIQKVRVRQVTTAEILKASSDPYSTETVRQSLDESPRSSMKVRSNTVNSPRNILSSRSDRGDRHSFSGSSGAGKSFSEDDSLAERIDSFYEEPELGPVLRSSAELQSPTQSVCRSESFSPVSTSSVNPFGSREQRASIRRYEIERMEPRKLPENIGSETDLSSPRTDPTPPPIPPKQPGTPIEKLLANQNFGTREQRGSLRRIQRTQSNSTPTSSTGDMNSPLLQRQGALIRREEDDTVSPIMMRRQGATLRKDSDSSAPSSPFRRQEAIRRSSNKSKTQDHATQQQQQQPKSDPTWYEYGSV